MLAPSTLLGLLGLRAGSKAGVRSTLGAAKGAHGRVRYVVVDHLGPRGAVVEGVVELGGDLTELQSRGTRKGERGGGVRLRRRLLVCIASCGLGTHVEREFTKQWGSGVLYLVEAAPWDRREVVVLVVVAHKVGEVVEGAVVRVGLLLGVEGVVFGDEVACDGVDAAAHEAAGHKVEERAPAHVPTRAENHNSMSTATNRTKKEQSGKEKGGWRSCGASTYLSTRMSNVMQHAALITSHICTGLGRATMGRKA